MWQPNFSQPVLWLRGDLGVTLTSGKISKWADQSGYGNDFTQATAGLRPAKVAASTHLNSQTTVSFDGTTVLSAANAASLQISADMAMVIVFYLAGDENYQCLISKGVAGEWDYYLRKASSVYRPNFNRENTASADFESPGSLALSTATVAFSNCQNQRATWMVNGVVQGQFVSFPNAGAVTTDPVTIGQRDDAVSVMNGEVAEIIVWNRALAQGEVNLLHQYLSNRYNISCPLSQLFYADFTAATLGKQSNLNGFGLGFARASVATVQTSAAAIDSTPTANQPRIGSVGASWGQGLVLEETRTNGVQHARDPHNWRVKTTCTFVTGAGTSPDGTTSVDSVEFPTNGGGGQDCYDEDNGAVTWPSAGMIGSVWTKKIAGAGQLEFTPGTNNGVGAYTFTPGTSWARTSGTTTTNALQTRYCFFDNFTTGQDITCLFDYVQAELGQFATEAMGSLATRAGEQLTHTDGTKVLSNGRIGMYVKLVPKGSSTQYASDMYLWHIDSNNYALVDHSTGNVKVNVNGTLQTLSTHAMSWAAQDVLEIWVEAGGPNLAVRASYKKNGGSLVVIGTGAVADSIQPSGWTGSLDLLCNGTAGQFTSWVQNIQFWGFGTKPTGF